MSAKLWFLITLGVYAFVVLLVYFVLCLINKDYDDEEKIGLSFCWPGFIIFGVIYTPFWVVRKSAEYVRRSMEKNEEEDDAYRRSN